MFPGGSELCQGASKQLQEILSGVLTKSLYFQMLSSSMVLHARVWRGKDRSENAN